MEHLIQKLDEKFSLTTYDNQNTQYNYKIFNDPKFLKLHTHNYKKVFEYFLLDNKSKVYKGNVTFAIKKDNKVVSPIKGSFGGFDFSNEINFETKLKFIKSVLHNLYKQKPNSIEIILPPEIYNLENNSHQLSILHNEDFHIHNIEINQYILLEAYKNLNSIKSGNRNNVIKCSKKGFNLKRLKSKEYENAYKIILENMNRRNYKISMTWESLSSMMSTFPSNFINFGLFDKEVMIAASICIKISEDILYLFYWGENKNYSGLSLKSYISNKISEFCIENNFKIFDLGTSSNLSTPNIGLINYKKSIGGYSCNKFKLIKLIN